MNKSHCYLAIPTQLTTRVTHINSPVAPKTKHILTIASFSLHSCAHISVDICCCWEYLYTRSKIHSKEVFTREWNLIFFLFHPFHDCCSFVALEYPLAVWRDIYFGCDFFLLFPFYLLKLFNCRICPISIRWEKLLWHSNRNSINCSRKEVVVNSGTIASSQNFLRSSKSFKLLNLNIKYFHKKRTGFSLHVDDVDGVCCCVVELRRNANNKRRKKRVPTVIRSDESFNEDRPTVRNAQQFTIWGGS